MASSSVHALTPIRCDEPDGNPDLRNGQTTNTVGGNNDQNPPTLTEYQDPLVGGVPERHAIDLPRCRPAQRPRSHAHLVAAVHEPLTWYENCYERERNKGLYTADQNLNNPRTRARNTRQNPNGQRRGLECPEVRDAGMLRPASIEDSRAARTDAAIDARGRSATTTRTGTRRRGATLRSSQMSSTDALTT